MLDVLDSYKEKGSFNFSINDRLSQVCTAPKHSSGIYVIYADVIKAENLIYIGISGRQDSNGEIIHRKDGIGGRIVKGKQFGDGRRRSWPKKMQEDNIKVLRVKWFITYGEYNKQFPRPIEYKMLEKILSENGCLPLWNKKV